ncbi:MAG: hypothetical protein IIW54_11945 [Lachnospiraceae bacterium]|nr:hypothetical protein [Lachnospiraceae bacterium]
MRELLGKEVKIGNKEGEITSILGDGYEVSFFNLNDGRTYISSRDIKKYLVNEEKHMKRKINITDQDIRCCDGFDICGDAVNATYELWFDVDKYFGTETRNTEAWINFYAKHAEYPD